MTSEEVQSFIHVGFFSSFTKNKCKFQFGEKNVFFPAKIRLIGGDAAEGKLFYLSRINGTRFGSIHCGPSFMPRVVKFKRWTISSVVSSPAVQQANKLLLFDGCERLELLSGAFEIVFHAGRNIMLQH